MAMTQFDRLQKIGYLENVREFCNKLMHEIRPQCKTLKDIPANRGYGQAGDNPLDLTDPDFANTGWEGFSTDDATAVMGAFTTLLATLDTIAPDLDKITSGV